MILEVQYRAEWNWLVTNKLLKQHILWTEDLPGVHLELGEFCSAIFYGLKISIQPKNINIDDIYDSVYKYFRNAIGDEFTNVLSDGRYGHISDCQRMADKIAMKCVRNNLFIVWLTFNQ